MSFKTFCGCHHNHCRALFVNQHRDTSTRFHPYSGSVNICIPQSLYSSSTTLNPWLKAERPFTTSLPLEHV